MRVNFSNFHTVCVHILVSNESAGILTTLLNTFCLSKCIFRCRNFEVLFEVLIEKSKKGGFVNAKINIGITYLEDTSY